MAMVTSDAEAGAMKTETMIRSKIMIAVGRNIQHCSSHCYAVAEPERRLIFKVQRTVVSGRQRTLFLAVP
jgi:hypothetical protein